MANVTILSDCVQGIPAVITLAPSIPLNQTGTGYFYKGAVVESTLFGPQTIVDTMIRLGAIQSGAFDPIIVTRASMTIQTPVRSGAVLSATSGASTS